MEISQVEFQFKGSRTYIQGPDLFNKMTDVGHPIESLSNIRFIAHNFIHTAICRMYLTQNKVELNNVPDICSRCQMDVDGKTVWLALTELKTDKAGDRLDFDEERIISLCSIKKESVQLTGQSPFSFIETIVSMNKYLHQRLFPDVKGKWIFTRIDLTKGSNEREKLELIFKHNMNYRLTKSDVVIDGEKMGELYFSLVKP